MPILFPENLEHLAKHSPLAAYLPTLLARQVSEPGATIREGDSGFVVIPRPGLAALPEQLQDLRTLAGRKAHRLPVCLLRLPLRQIFLACLFPRFTAGIERRPSVQLHREDPPNVLTFLNPRLGETRSI